MPIRMAIAKPVSRLIAAVTVAAIALPPLPAAAQKKGGLPLIRDAEIEQLMRDYTAPIFRVAGLSKANLKIILINDKSFNAFVVDGRRIFVNTGALQESTTPNQIIGVLAHETGHIAGGHLSKLHQELANVQTAALIGMLLGAAAMAAAGGGNGAGQAGMAAIHASQHVAQRSLLSYQRAHEEAADRAAVKFLAATGQSAKGMYETFKRFADQSMFSARFADPYAQSHPMPNERIAALTEIARASPYWDKKDPQELQARHDMMRAKLSGFMDPPQTVARRYPPSDNSLPARYARAIATYRHSDIRAAIAQIDALIAIQPNNPYFHELKGQALLENGRAAEAIAPLRRAASLAPDPTLIQILLGQALVATNNPALADEAITILRNGLAREPDTPNGYQQLAMAYGRKGDLAQADLASAQAAFARGDIKTARELAARAKTKLPVGSPGWVRADDIVAAKLPAAANRPN
ncbi:M48 family metalloprotease [Pseudorhodoplanes sp.]|uniref:M48 family metalloprotease n=1 Tax=Pseudorhodoplanes sp. TaxID=1934341 RepID=UPI002C0DB6CE|nr:M48 family metalloprotease [Pseudorhodoplanes sp.]HWV42646.1 M48 family metalloprotease [Pseudorhodoplanes sp.]